MPTDPLAQKALLLDALLFELYGGPFMPFSRLRLPALVVDTHHLRVAQRVGLVPPKATLVKAAALLQDYLPEDWDGQRVYDSYQRFMRHGQKVCYWCDPACSRGAIRAYCAYYAATTGKK